MSEMADSIAIIAIWCYGLGELDQEASGSKQQGLTQTTRLFESYNSFNICSMLKFNVAEPYV